MKSLPPAPGCVPICCQGRLRSLFQLPDGETIHDRPTARRSRSLHSRRTLAGGDFVPRVVGRRRGDPAIGDPQAAGPRPSFCSSPRVHAYRRVQRHYATAASRRGSVELTDCQSVGTMANQPRPSVDESLALARQNGRSDHPPPVHVAGRRRHDRFAALAEELAEFMEERELFPRRGDKVLRDPAVLRQLLASHMDANLERFARLCLLIG